MGKITMPIHTIGESNWIEKLTAFLENYDVGVLGLDAFDNDFNLPKTVVDYYTCFGGIDSSDFMYNLYRPPVYSIIAINLELCERAFYGSGA